MLIFMPAELQIRQDGRHDLMLFDDRHGFTALQAVQSGSFSYTCDTECSLRRAGVAAQAGDCA
jgi:hypothetical protein